MLISVRIGAARLRGCAIAITAALLASAPVCAAHAAPNPPVARGAPKPFAFSKTYGGLSLALPAGLPEVRQTFDLLTAAATVGWESVVTYSGTNETTSVILLAGKYGPESDYSLDRAADGINDETRRRIPSFRETSRLLSRRAGAPSLQMRAVISTKPAMHARYELIADGGFFYEIAVMAPAATSLDSGAVAQVFQSVRLGPLPKPKVDLALPNQGLDELIDAAFPGALVDTHVFPREGKTGTYPVIFADGRRILVTINWAKYVDPLRLEPETPPRPKIIRVTRDP